jgi:hypothetical protein
VLIINRYPIINVIKEIDVISTVKSKISNIIKDTKISMYIFVSTKMYIVSIFISWRIVIAYVVIEYHMQRRSFDH